MWTADKTIQSTTATIVTGTTQIPATDTWEACTIWDNPTCDLLLVASHYFSQYATTLAYALGIPGSVITIVILARMRPFNSSSVWLLALTCTDLYSLSMRFSYSQLILYAKKHPGHWWCKFFYILAEFCEYTSYLYLVGLTVERFIAVWFPLKMTAWCNKTRAVMSVLAVQVMCLSSSLHYLETMSYNRAYCEIKLKYQAFVMYTYQYRIQNTIFLLLPAVTLITLNVLIVSRLATARRFQKRMQEQQPKGKDNKHQRQVNRMLAASSIWFIICVTLEIVYGYTEIFWGPFDDLPERARIIVMNLSGVMRMYNHAANFLLYVIAARKFRSEIIRLVTCNLYVGVGKRALPIGENAITSKGARQNY